MTQQKTKFEKFFSFNIDDDELKNQVQNYKTLAINKSYRGICTLIISGISFMTLLALALMEQESANKEAAFFGISIYLMIAYFIHQGKRKAILTAMVIWSLDKMLYIAFILQSGGQGAVFVFCFWILVMRFFWRALEVENFRIELQKKVNSNSEPLE